MGHDKPNIKLLNRVFCLSAAVFFSFIFIFLLTSPSHALLKWEATNGPWGGDVTRLDISDDGALYAGTLGGGVFRSITSGESWTWKSEGMALYSREIKVLRCGSGEVVFASPDGMGIYRSDNGGNRWYSKNNQLLDYSILDIETDPADRNIVYAATLTRGVQKSTDLGESWQPTTLNESSVDAKAVNCIAVGSYEGGGSAVYAATNGKGLWRSTDQGLTWVRLSPEVFSTGNMPYVAVSPSRPNVVYANYAGIYRSKNYGVTWETGAAVSLTAKSIDIDPVSSEVVYATADNTIVYKSTNECRSFTALNTYGQPYFRDVVIDPRDPSVLYFGNVGRGIFKSKTYGASIEVSNAGLNNAQVRAIAVVSDEGSSTVFVFARSGEPANVNSILGLYRSDDLGSTWALVSGFPTTLEAVDILSDPFDPDYLYVAIYNSSPCFYRSANKGVDWTGVNVENETFMRSVTADPASPEVLYAVTYGLASNEVYRSLDRGGTWALWADGAPTNETANFIHAVSGESGTIVFLGTSGPASPSVRYGIYRRNAQSGVWESASGVSTKTPPYNGITQISDDPVRKIVFISAITEILKKSFADSALAWELVASVVYPARLMTDPGNIGLYYYFSYPYRADFRFFSLSEGRVPFQIEENFGVPHLSARYALWDASAWPIEIDPNTPPSSRTLFGGIPGRSVWKASSVTTLVPAPPSSLHGTASGTSSITWEWSDNSNNEDGFRVYILGGATTVGAVAVNITDFTETSLATNTAYSRYVKGYNASGLSDPSGPAQCYTLANKPGVVASKEVGRQNITITWEAKGNPSYTNYEVYRSTIEVGSGLPIYWQYVSTVATTEYPDTGLTFETTYYYRVRASNGDGVPTGFVTSEGFVTGPPVPSGDTIPPLITRVRFDGKQHFDNDIIYHTPKITAVITDRASTEAPYFVTPEGVDVNSVRLKFDDYIFSISPLSVQQIGGGPVPITVEVNYTVPTRLGVASYIVSIEATDRAYPWYNKVIWTGRVRVMGERPSIVGSPVAYPMPFSPQRDKITTMSYTLSTNADVTIFMYDVSGRIVMTRKFSAGAQGGRAGYNQFTWNGITDFGNVAGNGIYIYKMISKGKVIGTGKMVVLD